MGRKPNPVVLEYFLRGDKIDDASNRYAHTCKSCNEHFPKGRTESMKNHISKSCPGLSPPQRQEALSRWENMIPQSAPSANISDGQLQMSGPPVDLPRAAPWTPLELLAEASRQSNMQEQLESHDGPVGGSNSGSVQGLADHTRGSRLELQELNTLDNPPVSYEQRVSGSKKVPQQQAKVPRRETTFSMASMPFNTQAEVTRSVSPHPNLAMAASSIAAAAAARHIPNMVASQAESMVDPQLLDEDINAHEMHEMDDKSMEQVYNEANVAYTENTFHEQPNQQTMLWHHMMEGATSFPDPQPTEKPQTVENELPRTTYAPIAMNPPMTTEFSAEYGNGERSQKTKTRKNFSPNRRKEVQGVRKIGACIRCRVLRKVCDSDEHICKTCQNVENPRTWKITCTRSRFPDMLMILGISLHGSLAFYEVSSIQNQIVFEDSPDSLETSQHAETSIFAVFNASRGIQLRIDDVTPLPDSLRGNADPTTIRILNESDDIVSKLEAYVKQISYTFYDCESKISRFMSVTLTTAHNLAVKGKENDLLLLNVLELWSFVHILVDNDKPWVMSERQHEDADAGQGRLIDHGVNGISYSAITHQLNAAAEKKATELCKSVLAEIEKRLVDRTGKRNFELYLACMILFNCVEKYTWLFMSWGQDSFKPRWPLDKAPSWYIDDSKLLINIIVHLLQHRKVTPITKADENGFLQVVPLHVDPTCEKGIDHENAKKYYKELQLNANDLHSRQVNHCFNEQDPRCYELSLCSRILLPASSV